MRTVFDITKKTDIIWLVFWSIIYVSFLILDIIFPNSLPVTLLKITGIIFCVIYSYIKFPKDKFLTAALLLTLFADIILATNNVSVFGVTIFCFVQLAHIFRLSSYKVHTFIIVLIADAFVYLVSVFNDANPLYALVGIYGLGMFMNIFLSGKWYFFRRSQASLAAFLGFLLFLACDLCVAVSFVSNIGAIPPFWQGLMSYAAWAFYYPAQILISNSTTL